MKKDAPVQVYIEKHVRVGLTVENTAFKLNMAIAVEHLGLYKIVGELELARGTRPYQHRPCYRE